MAEHYKFGYSSVFALSKEGFDLVSTTTFPDVATYSTSMLNSAANQRQATAERMKQLNNLYKFNGGELNTGWLSSHGITDPVLQALILPNGAAMNLADAAAVHAYYASIGQQVTALGTAADQSQSSDVQGSMSAVTQATSTSSTYTSLMSSFIQAQQQMFVKIL
ncbi:MAG: hypothetical protein ACOYK9_05695 [Chlamydiia bacterium]